jgi:hypothetical protein
MAKPEPSKQDLAVAQRLKRLRQAEAKNAAEFAARLGLAPPRWYNFEAGFPLPRDVAIKIVQTVPGVTLDWIYLGRREGLTVAMAQKLGEMPSDSAETTKRKAAK